MEASAADAVPDGDADATEQGGKADDSAAEADSGLKISAVSGGLGTDEEGEGGGLKISAVSGGLGTEEEAEGGGLKIAAVTSGNAADVDDDDAVQVLDDDKSKNDVRPASFYCIKSV
jgi:hypothetical protein